MSVNTAKLAELEKQRFALTQKISDLKADEKENDLVLDALKTADKTRKCMRMVGGILVERTVGEVQQALTSHSEQIQKVISTYETELKKYEEEWENLAKEMSLNK